jgi:rhodanese-related sulfurtransferase
MRTDGVLMCLEKQDFYKLLKEPYVITLALADLEESMANSVCVDVRSEEEYSLRHLHEAVNVPLNILAIKSRLLSKEHSYIFYCDTGRRSRAAAYLLAQQGYKALALTDCPNLFSQSKYEQLLGDTQNYLLRDGVAVRGI